ncbi:MAG TPA: hypothetical protein VGM32_07725, partial [Rhodopila sp.]
SRYNQSPHPDRRRMTDTETTPLHLNDVFMHLVVAYLAPIFLAATGGDIRFARIAAIQAVTAYAARNPADLLPIAQSIAFGLASLDSLNRSMADDLPVALVLRLRSNAASLSRASEQCRRALDQPAPIDHPVADPEAERLHEEAIITDIALAQQRLAQGKAPASHPKPGNQIQDLLQAALAASPTRHPRSAAQPSGAPP